MKLISDVDVKGKKVIVRVDFNVPIKDGKILDDNRIVSSLKTINYLIDKIQYSMSLKKFMVTLYIFMRNRF